MKKNFKQFRHQRVEKLSLLNSLVHPATLSDAAAWMKEQVAPYIIKEAALLFESGAKAGARREALAARVEDARWFELGASRGVEDFAVAGG